MLDAGCWMSPLVLSNLICIDRPACNLTYVVCSVTGPDTRLGAESPLEAGSNIIIALAVKQLMELLVQSGGFVCATIAVALADLPPDAAPSR